MIRQKLIPAPGMVSVVRERVGDTFDEEGRILRPVGEEHASSVDRSRKVNPWALVVGVGAPRRTPYGTTIETAIQPDDKVLVQQVGKDIELNADGQVEYLYVLPFEGVMASLWYECSVCKWEGRQAPEAARCPNGCVDLHRIDPVMVPQ